VYPLVELKFTSGFRRFNESNNADSRNIRKTKILKSSNVTDSTQVPFEDFPNPRNEKRDSDASSRGFLNVDIYEFRI
jgi:hypothetical protein